MIPTPPLRPAPLVEEHPRTTLLRWRTFDLPDGARHVVGYATDTERERVSPRLVEFDIRTLCARTGSGRVYELEGAPEAGIAADYVWNWFAAKYGLSGWRDSTGEVWAAHQRTRH